MDNYEKYEEYTRTRDWKALCTLNNVELDSFGTKKELGVLPSYLEEGEVVFALTSGVMSQTTTSNSSDAGMNTWLVVLTSERFLFLDHAFFTKSVDTQSVRHNMVQAVSASQGWILGKITIDLGSRLIVIDNCQKATVAAIADLANKWLRETANRDKQAAAPVQVVKEESPLDKLAKLKQLHDAGALTEEEFSLLKGKILAEM